MVMFALVLAPVSTYLRPDPKPPPFSPFPDLLVGAPPLNFHAPPEPPDPPDPPDLSPSIRRSSVPVVAAPPLNFSLTSNGLSGSVFSSIVVRVHTACCRFQSSPVIQLELRFLSTGISSPFVKSSEGIVSVSVWNKSYLDERYLFLGGCCVELCHLPLNEDVPLPLNPFLPQFEDVTRAMSFRSKFQLPLYEDVTLRYPTLLPQHEVGIRTFGLLALVSIISGNNALSCGNIGLSFHGGDEAPHIQDSSSRLCGGSPVAEEALEQHEALHSPLLVGLSNLTVLSDSTVLFFALRSRLDLNEIAGCMFDISNLATLFTPLSFIITSAQHVLAGAFAMYVLIETMFFMYSLLS